MKSIIQMATGIGMIVAVTLVANAFTAPTLAPPGNNIAEPINRGIGTQIKSGALQALLLIASSGVIVGTNNNTFADYLKFDTESTFGGLTGNTPPASDCNEAVEYGRAIFNNVNNDIYICGGTGWYRIHGEKVI